MQRGRDSAPAGLQPTSWEENVHQPLQLAASEEELGLCHLLSEQTIEGTMSKTKYIFKGNG